MQCILNIRFSIFKRTKSADRCVVRLRKELEPTCEGRIGAGDVSYL